MLTRHEVAAFLWYGVVFTALVWWVAQRLPLQQLASPEMSSPDQMASMPVDRDEMHPESRRTVQRIAPR